MSRIMSGAQALAFFAPGMTSRAEEALHVAYLDAAGRVLGDQLFSEGSVCRVDLPLRTIVSDALALGSAGLVLAHNHPSGDASPSPADLAATRLLAELAQPLGIRLHDHLIFGNDEHRSLRGLGLV